MKYTYLLLAASIGLLVGCSQVEQDFTNVNSLSDGDLVEKVIFEVLPIKDGDAPATRASAVPAGGTVNFAWEENDMIGIYPNKGSQIFFMIEDGAGSSSATFDGGGWALKQNANYVSYYPFVADFFLSRDEIPVSFAGQKQVGTESPFNGARYFLATEPTSSENGVLRFSYKTLNTIINVNATLPAGTYTKMSLTTEDPLFVEEGTYSLDDHVIVGTKFTSTLEIELEDVVLTEEGTIPIYIMSAPVDLKGKEVTVRIISSEGQYFECVKTPSKAYEAGTRYGLTCDRMESESQPNNVIYYTSTDGSIVTPYKADVFGANIVSNEYVDGQGIITFDGDITSFGTYAFRDKTKLTSISIPNSVTIIGTSALSGCTALESVTLPNGVAKIESIAFMDCSSLSGIVFPESLVEIGTSAFIRCSSLPTITLPESVTNLGDKAFAGCISLSSFSGKYSADNGRCLIRDNTIIAIAPYGLTSYSIPSGVTAIEYAFSGCDLFSITIPNTVETIGHDAFYGCKNLSSISIPESVTIIGDQAFIGTGLVSITIPSNIKTIDACAFENCRNLESITIEEGVTRIGSRSFYNCSRLSSIILPDSVNLIYAEAFLNCTNLSSITVKAVTPPTLNSGNNNAFSNTICPIYVPSESVEAYKSATGWIAYSDRIQAIPTSSTTGVINGHAYVDMGNGLKWATMNVGANSQIDYGDYFAWGETEPYYNSLSPLTWKVDKSSGYDWTSYQFNPSGDGASFTRYTGSDESILLSEDDAASVNWGGTWRTPTYYDWYWLKSNSTWEWENINQVYGYRVTSSINGNIIFLPAAGYFIGKNMYLYLQVGFYWSSSMGNVGNTPVARGVYLASSQVDFRDDYRYRGQSIRPVSD